MNVSLTPELEKWVVDKVRSGLYQSASEVVREGLRLLVERERSRDGRVEELRQQISVGVQQADQGELRPFDESVLGEIKQAGRAAIANRRERRAG
jgi:antitoxin ParD1/3/4